MEQLPTLITSNDVKQYLKRNDTTLYSLLKQRVFPSFRVGRKYYIDQDKFISWIEKNMRNKK